MSLIHIFCTVTSSARKMLHFDILHNDVGASVSTYNKTYVTFSKKSKKNLVGTCYQKSCQVTRHAGNKEPTFTVPNFSNPYQISVKFTKFWKKYQIWIKGTFRPRSAGSVFSIHHNLPLYITAPVGNMSTDRSTIRATVCRSSLFSTAAAR
jgi:hypothetical protein